MTTDRATAASWVRDVAAGRWDKTLAERDFTRSAGALAYTRKVADGGRQQLVLDLSARSGEFQLSLRATVAYASVAKLAIRLLGSRAGAFGKSNIVDMGLLDTLEASAPMWVFSSPEGLAALAPQVDGYLLDPMVSYLDARATVAAFTEAKRAEWLAAEDPARPSRFPVVVAAGELTLGEPAKALATLERAYPAGTPGRAEYAEAFTVARELAPDAQAPPASAAPVLTFELTTANSLLGIPVPNPGPDQIERVVRNLTEDRHYTVLQRSDGVYAQVGIGLKTGSAPGSYALEHRAGPEGEHLRADTTDQDAAVLFLQRFRTGDDWRGHHEWRQLEL
ncbi:hypothetical protein ACQPZX_04435 [Actinoplanes sp. CA-142083]|uniref:hypothetical protein n=1 Tax=Actinoplanes sp. CA-142083 TaxID=3239903 RepID=UPI003D8E371A